MSITKNQVEILKSWKSEKEKELEELRERIEYMTKAIEVIETKIDVCKQGNLFNYMGGLKDELRPKIGEIEGLRSQYDKILEETKNIFPIIDELILKN